MLRHTFCHIPGIGLLTEKLLWERGVHSWDEVGRKKLDFISPQKQTILAQSLEESEEHLQQRDAVFFAEVLPFDQQWRLFGEFRNQTAFLDIETTGLGAPRDQITTIVVYDGERIHSYVLGENMDEFVPHILEYKLIITFNGKAFDIPFIERFLSAKIPIPHIDLRFELKRFGYRGGLKKCEQQLGVERTEVRDVDGYFAVLLWREYQRTGDPRVLETLLAYNTYDSVNLETLMVLAYNMGLRDLPFEQRLKLELPEFPRIPFKAHREIIEAIQEDHGWQSEKE